MTETTLATSEVVTDNNYANYMESLKPILDGSVFHPQIFDEDDYNRIIASPSVIMSGDTPQLLGLNVADFVHQERCLQIAQTIGQFDSSNIYIATVPVEILATNIGKLRQEISDNNSEKLIFTELDIVNKDTQQVLQGEMADYGLAINTLEHPKIHSEAALNLFELNVSLVPSDEHDRQSISEVIGNRVVPGSIDSESGRLVTIRGNELSDEELSQLWGLFSSRFTDISDNIPVRLEETETTTRHLMKDSRYSFIYKADKEGNIMACLFFTDDQEAYPWISSDFIQRREAIIKQKSGLDPYSIFIPGIAADRSGNGSLAASEVLYHLTEVLANTNQAQICVRFECTDVSSKYVPLISMRAARQQPAFNSSSVEAVGQKKFLALRLDPANPI